MSLISKEILLVKLDNVWGRIVCEDYDVIEGAYCEFGVFAENYFFQKKYKAGIWDGKIRGVRKDGTFFLGLFKEVKDYLSKQSEYTLEIDPKFEIKIDNKDTLKEEFVEVTNKMLDSVKCDLSPRYYQWRAALKAYYYKRMIVEHCTSSGKSLTIAILINYILYKNPKFKILVLVPRLDLVEQMTEDYATYGIDKKIIGKFTGEFKDFDEPIIVSTWQSIHTQPFLLSKFNAIIADECLDPNTLITLSNNEKKYIKDIKIGDEVKTLNENNKKIENKKVIDVYKNMSIKEKMYKITLENGEILNITGNHKVLTKNRGWVRVDNLTSDDDLECHSIKSDINKL